MDHARPEVCVTSNEQMADQLRRQAGDCMTQRKALLCASVALAETTSVTAARKVITGWDGPADVKAAALDLLSELASSAAGQ